MKSRYIPIPSSIVTTEASAHLEISSSSDVRSWYLNQQRAKHRCLSLNVTMQVGRKIQLGYSASGNTLDGPHAS
jgi:hypothetical protein